MQSLVDPEKVEEEPEQSEEVQPEGFDEPEEPKMPEEEQEPAFEDMEAMLDLLQQPDEEVEKEKQDTTEVPQETKEPEPEVSREPVAVDDIFQDALSAVGYSGDEEDLEQKLNMSSETQNENQDSQFDDILALDDIMQNESGVEEEPAEEGVRGARSVAEHGHLNDVDYLIGSHIFPYSMPGEQIGVSIGPTLATTKLNVTFSGLSSPLIRNTFS